jgi:hypothetical protein
MLVQMMEYRHPAFRSKAVRFYTCRPDGLVRRTIQRRPSGQMPARLIRCVISATCLSGYTRPSWPTASFHAEPGSYAIASSSAPVIAHPTVNRTFRRGLAIDSRTPDINSTGGGYELVAATN